MIISIHAMNYKKRTSLSRSYQPSNLVRTIAVCIIFEIITKSSITMYLMFFDCISVIPIVTRPIHLTEIRPEFQEALKELKKRNLHNLQKSIINTSLRTEMKKR
mmetsp:Transcript_39742/g.44779  ORF Transcript_39742/g.44779 Transcript_39742/m.44779 type:complete len:104 (-) Transcript_39742:117-428(-)